MRDTECGRFYALLMGIDNYSESPLSGCVNDIDQVHEFLIEKLAVSPDSIVRLAAPAPSPTRPVIPAQRLPTYANMVAALRHLGSSQIQRNDRVFIYYSGHGSYEKISPADSYFECLVPLDYENASLLFDVELNALLQAIADRSGDVTVILDCCHAAGATRAGLRAQERTRFLPLGKRSATLRSTGHERSQTRSRLPASRPAPAEYTVVAACHADEVASECRMPPGAVGKPHGLLSYSLFEILRRAEPRAIAELRWSDIWEQLKATVNRAKPGQRPMLLGPPERRIFGGPWLPQDTGYAVRPSEDGSYVIAAGTLAGLGVGALLAVYGPAPARFPPLDSEADRLARLGVLVVESVAPAESVARSSLKAAPIRDLPSAARSRLIKPGTPDLLRVAVSAHLDPQVRRLLDDGAPWNRFVLLAEDDANAECNIGQYADGDIWIGDDLFGPGDASDKVSPGPLGKVSRRDATTAQAMTTGVRAALNHYAQYVVPLRVYRTGGFTLPRQCVEVRVLDCTAVADPLTLEQDASVRREAPRDALSQRYVIGNGAPIAFHLYNTLRTDLYVFLLLCNNEGQLEFLDGDVLLHARSGKIIWQNNIIGRPFSRVPSNGWGIDRLIVITTDQKGLDLRVLDQKRTLNQVIKDSLAGGTPRSSGKNAAPLGYSAVLTVIETGRPPASPGM